MEMSPEPVVQVRSAAPARVRSPDPLTTRERAMSAEMVTSAEPVVTLKERPSGTPNRR
jgi:hypothetical protein